MKEMTQEQAPTLALYKALSRKVSVTGIVDQIEQQKESAHDTSDSISKSIHKQFVVCGGWFFSIEVKQ